MKIKLTSAEMDQPEFNPKKARAQKLRQDKYKSHRGGASSQSSVRKPGPPTKPEIAATSGSVTHQNLEAESENIEIPIEDKQFSRRKLKSNWDRYEELPVEYESNKSYSWDELLNAERGSEHLVLQHEKHWDQEEVLKQQSWFQLNIPELNNNLSSIPFFIRLGLSPQLFTEEQLSEMKLKATQSLETNSIVHKHINLIKQKDSEKSSETLVEQVPDQVLSSSATNESETNYDNFLKSPKDSQSSNIVEKQNNEDELDALLALSETKKSVSHVETPINRSLTPDDDVPSVQMPLSIITSTTQNTQNLDDWLDSILES